MRSYIRDGRFLQSGIICLSDLQDNPHPDPFHTWCPLCVRASKRLRPSLPHKTISPWLLENRLRAEVFYSSWKDRKLLQPKRLGDGKLYDCLRLPELFITSGTPVLHILRSLRGKKKKLRRLYGKHDFRTPWIVVDFYLDGQSSLG